MQHCGAVSFSSTSGLKVLCRYKVGLSAGSWMVLCNVAFLNEEEDMIIYNSLLAKTFLNRKKRHYFMIFGCCFTRGRVGGDGTSDSCATVYGVFLLGIIASIGAIRLAFVVVDVACVHELSSALLAGEVVRTPFFI